MKKAEAKIMIMKSYLAVSLVIALGLTGCRRAPTAKDLPATKDGTVMNDGHAANDDGAMNDDGAANDDGTMNDEELISSIRQAMAAGASPENIEHHVGARAIINTTRSDHRRGSLTIAAFVPDTELAIPLPPLHDPSWEVVYWGRPVESPDPKIVGVAWDSDGNAEIFFGEVLPP